QACVRIGEKCRRGTKCKKQRAATEKRFVIGTEATGNAFPKPFDQLSLSTDPLQERAWAQDLAEGWLSRLESSGCSGHSQECPILPKNTTTYTPPSVIH